jgi:RNA-directed DNA polymerase
MRAGERRKAAPLSPLLANLYMRRFILGWKALGHEARLDAHIVNYADDFVICCRGSAEKALTAMRTMMSQLKLTVNETKTRLCRGPDEPFNFLGYTIGRLYSPRTGGRYIGVRPSDKSLRRLCLKIRAQTERRWLWLDTDELVGRLNRSLRGWADYFCLGTVSKAYRRVTAHVCHRLRQWLVRKHKVRGSQWARYADQYLHETLGLLRLQRRPADLSCATG